MHLILSISSNLSQEEVEMEPIATPKSKSLKQFYYLGARAWNNLPLDLRQINDCKMFSKEYKLQLLHSINTDTNYVPNNSYDYFYKLM